MVKQKKLRILAASDIEGNSMAAEKLAEKAEKENVDLVILAGDLHGIKPARGIISPFIKRNKKVIFIPGNWDTSAEVALTESIYGINNFDGKYVTYEGVDIVGIGTKDMKLHLNQEKSLEKLIKNFERIKNKDSRKILVSHLHAEGTIGEFSGIKGEKALRKAIEYFQPEFFIAGHIHEAEGLEQKIGKTRILHVGKKGKIIEV